MPIYKVEAPNGSILQLEGPEGASEQDIIQAATELYSGAPAQPTEQPSATAGPIEALIGGSKRFGSSAITGLAAPFGAEQAALQGIQRQQNITERPGASLEAVKQAYNKDGLLSAVGEVFSQVPSAVTEQAPFLASMWAGAKTGAMLPVPPQFKPITAIGGALIAPFLVQSGSNIERQAQEQLQEGEDINIKLGRAYSTAAVQASLDVVAMKLGLSKLLGIKPAALATEGAEKAAKEIAAKKLAKEGIAKTVGVGAAKVTAAEVPTEMFQQLLERAQAGLDLTSDEAIKEYMEAGYAAGLLAPLGSVSRGFERADANKLIKEQEEKANQIKQEFEKDRQQKIAFDEKVAANQAAREAELNKEYQEKGQKIIAEANEQGAKEAVTTLLSSPEGTLSLIADVENSLKTKEPSQYFPNITNNNQKKTLLKDLKNRQKLYDEEYKKIFEGAPEVTTDDTWKSLGIGNTAKIRKGNTLNGLDVNVVEDNKKIRKELEKYITFPGLSAKIEEKVQNYLNSIPTVEQLEAKNVERRAIDSQGARTSTGVLNETGQQQYESAIAQGDTFPVGATMGSGVSGIDGTNRGTDGGNDTLSSLWDTPAQTITSADTSINATKLPAAFTKLNKEGKFKKGSINMDIGGGRFDNANTLLQKNEATNVVYDPFNRSKEQNQQAVNKAAEGKSDTATINNVLNVIKDEVNQLRVLRQAQNALKPGGEVFVSVYEGSGTGVGKATTKGYQQNKKLKDYMDTVKKVFPNATIKDGIIRAKKEKVADATSKDTLSYRGPTLLTVLRKLGGINYKDIKDITGEPKVQSRTGYGALFRRLNTTPTLTAHIENGSLDAFLPYNMRLESTSDVEAFDPSVAYDYLADKIKNEEKVIPYEIQEGLDLETMQQVATERELTEDEVNDLLAEASLEQPQAEPQIIAPTPREGTRSLLEKGTPTVFTAPPKKAKVDPKTLPEGVDPVPQSNSTGGNGTVFNDPDNDPDSMGPSENKKSKNYLDWFETRFFSSDAALNNAIRRGMQRAGVPWNKFKKILYKASTAQALHSENVAHKVLELGGIEYDPETMKFKAVENANGSWLQMVNTIRELGKKYNIKYEEAEELTNLYLEAKRLEGVQAENARLDAEIQALQDAGAKAADVNKLKDLKKIVHLDDQTITERVNKINQFPELADIQAKWNGTRESLINFSVESGLYSREQANALLDAMDYVPFYRIQEEEGETVGPKGYSRGLLDFADPKRFKGSTRPVDNIIDNMERWISYTVRRGIANRAAINLKDAAIEYLPDEVRQVGKIKKGRSQNTIKIRENIVEDGIEINRENFYEFDDPMYIDAFTGMEAMLLPALKFMRPFTDLLRQTIVLNPLFSISQLPQDAYGAMFTSGLKQPFKVPVEIFSEFFKTLTGTSQTRKELMGFGVVGQRDYSAFTDRADSKVAQSLKKASLRDLLLSPFEKFANASDNAVRQAVYNRTLLETGGTRVGGKIMGGNKDAALEKAFEIINFRRAGSSPIVSAGRQTIPFFGAYLQAMNVAQKTISGKGISVQEKNEAIKVLIGTATKALLLSMVYSFLLGDDEGYEKLDPAVRNRRLILPGTDGLSIPLRNDIFTLVTKIIPENLIQRYKFEGIDDTKLMKSLADATALAIVGPTPLPQAITPILETSINYDFFTGRPIVGQFEQQLEKELQYNNSTMEIARLFSDITGNTTSPKTWDHLIKGYLGYTAGLIGLATNDVIAAGYGRERPDLSGRDFVASIPGMSMFVSREFGTKAQSDFYELRDEVMTAVASFNRLKQNDIPTARLYMKEKKDLLKLKSTVNRMGSLLSKIRQRARIITESDMPAEQKKVELKRLKEMEQRVYANAGTLREKAGF